MPNNTLLHQLTDAGEGLGDQVLDCIVDLTDHAIAIGFMGFGECGAADRQGRPVRVELYEGKLRLLVWSDINSEDPTHTIVLDGAKETKRNPE